MTTMTYQVKQQLGFATNYKNSTIMNGHMPALVLLEEPQLYKGYINGYCQPVARLTLQINAFDSLHTQHLHQLLDYCFYDHLITFNPIQSANDLIGLLGEAISALQKSAGLPILDSIQIHAIPEKTGEFLLWIPMLYEACFYPALSFVLQLFNQYTKTTQFLPNLALTDHIKELIGKFRTYAPTTFNSCKFLEAAHHQGIPWAPLTQNIFQFGYGRNSHWLDSTFTDKTPLVSAVLAKNKIDTLNLLRNAGLPTPEQHVACTEAEAIAHANKIGYPVVIKPINQDGGLGVFSHLVSEKGVRKAYQSARQYSPNVILEKHIEGKDYRLIVFNGQLVWAIERIPGGVTGNGVNNIQELVEKINQDPARGATKILKPICLSEDTTDFLTEQGFTYASILKMGQFVALNRIANICTGGTPVSVFDKVHPDNKRLMETAANLFRLDIAGIDFITPDIQQSYLKTRGVIIEVNAQPQIGTITAGHLFKDILSHLLPNQGRIPIIIVYGNLIDDAVIQQLQLSLGDQSVNIGRAQDGIAYINNKQISDTSSLFIAGRALLLNNTVDSLIYCMKPCERMECPELPFDRYDTLFYSEGSQPVSESLINACRGQVIPLEGAF